MSESFVPVANEDPMNVLTDSAGKTKWPLVALLLFFEGICAFIGVFIAGFLIHGDVQGSFFYAIAFAVLILVIDIISLALFRKPILSTILPKRRF